MSAPVTKLHRIPTSRYPLNWKRYSRIYDELDKAVEGFDAHGHHDLSEAVAKVRAELYAAWNTIQAKERLELAAGGSRSQEG